MTTATLQYSTDQVVDVHDVLDGVSANFMEEFVTRCMEEARDSNKAGQLFAAIIAAEGQTSINDARQLFFDDDEVLRALCRRGVTEMLHFLYASANKSASDGALSPSAFVDFFWHEFYLFDPTYTQFCFAIGTRRIMHLPIRSGAQNLPAASSSSGRVHALREMRRYGFSPEPLFWHDPALTDHVSASDRCTTCSVGDSPMISLQPDLVQFT